MYVIMRRYAEIGASMYEIVARKAGKGVVPMLKGQPGFRCYGGFVSEDGDGISVTIFDNRERATLANEQVRGWARDNLRDLVPASPEVFSGDCGVVEVAREQGAPQHQPPFIMVWEFAGLGLLEPTGETVRRHILPSIVGSPGFRAVYMFKDERDQSRGVTVTLFDSRSAAMRSHEQSVRAFREQAGDIAPSLVRVASGRAIVFASAA